MFRLLKLFALPIVGWSVVWIFRTQHNLLFLVSDADAVAPPTRDTANSLTAGTIANETALTVVGDSSIHYSTTTTTATVCPRISSKDLQLKAKQKQDQTLLQWFNGLCNGTYVEIRALGGILYSNSFVFSRQLHWKGVLIESSPEYYQRLKRNRWNEIALIHANVCRDTTANATSCSSFRDLLQQYAPSYSFFDVLFLHINDYSVLSSLDKVSFGMICVENPPLETNKRKQLAISTLLQQQGYHVIQRFMNVDYFVNNNFGLIYQHVLDNDEKDDDDNEDALVVVDDESCTPTCTNCTNFQLYKPTYKYNSLAHLVGMHKTTNSSKIRQAVCVWYSDNVIIQHLPHWLELMYRCYGFWFVQHQRHPTSRKAVLEISSTAQKWFEKAMTKSPLAQGLWNLTKMEFGGVEVIVTNSTNETFPEEEKEELRQIRAHPLLNHGYSGARPWFPNPESAQALRQAVISHAFPNQTAMLLDGCNAHVPSSNTTSASSSLSNVRIGLLNRLGSRQVLNHKEVVAALQPLSSQPIRYATFEQASFENQVEFFANVDILVSPHGAQLSGVPFMPPCGSVLEILPKNYHFHNFFGTLVSSSNLTSTQLYLSDGNVDEEMNLTISSQKHRIIARGKKLCLPVPQVVSFVKKLISKWNECCGRPENETMEPVSIPSTAVDNEFESPLPSLVGGDVFVLDAIWNPSSQRLVLIALTPSIFEPFENPVFDERHSNAINLTFPYESLRSPMTLVPNLQWNGNESSLDNCTEIQTSGAWGMKGNSDPSDDKLFMVICHVNTFVSSGVNTLSFNQTILASFDETMHVYNAAKKMTFNRMPLPLPRNETHADKHNTTKRVSIVIKPVSNYSPLIPDLLDYYKQQGVAHVYFGLIHPSDETLSQFQQAIAPHDDFVSLNWFESNDVAFDYNMKSGHILLKAMFDNSVLHHAKAFGDDALMVADLDDVLVSMNPTSTTFVEELTAILQEEENSKVCYGILSPRIVWNRADDDDKMNSMRLGERYPKRCNKVGVYPKSVAFLKNGGADYVSIHYHGACPSDSKYIYLNQTRITMHHYTSWWTTKGKTRWQKRFKCEANDTEVPSELAVFQSEGIRRSASDVR